MIDFTDNTLILTIAIYLCSCYVLYNMKPKIMFSENNDFLCFGLNKNETIFPYWLVTSLIGIVSYYLLTSNKHNNRRFEFV